MNSKTLRIFVVLSVLLMAGMVVVQYFWFQQAYHIQDRDFDRRVTASLRTVCKRILDVNNNSANELLRPVRRITSNYYSAQVNDTINAQILEAFLKQEFAKSDIRLNFEYGIYDCLTDNISKKTFVCYAENCDPNDLNTHYDFPKLDIHNYYFGVYFPDKQLSLLGDLNNWFVSSAVLLVVLLFFVYALMVIFKQKRLSEIQNDFINNMTHEFKTPISTISISSEVLMKPDILQNPERLLSYASIIRKEAARLKKNVDTVLQTANIDQKIDKLKLEKVEVNELLEELCLNCEPIFKEKGGQINLQLQATASTVKADRLHLSNVIHNLIDNGVKYCEQTPLVTLQTYTQGKELVIAVVDNGIGISEKDQKHVFQKFFRVHTGDVHNVKGFGLGLYYVKEMIEGHKGRIELKSKLNQGSEFRLILPLQV